MRAFITHLDLGSSFFAKGKGGKLTDVQKLDY